MPALRAGHLVHGENGPVPKLAADRPVVRGHEGAGALRHVSVPVDEKNCLLAGVIRKQRVDHGLESLQAEIRTRDDVRENLPDQPEAHLVIGLSV